MPRSVHRRSRRPRPATTRTPERWLTLGAEYVGDYPAAVIFGIFFRYFAIVAMRGLSERERSQKVLQSHIS